jgi:hypothetical protein
MTDQHAGTYQAYLDAQAAANEARGSSQPTLRNTPEPGTPEADQVAELDAAAATAWDRHSGAVLADPGPEAESDPEAVVDGPGCSVRDLEAYEAAMDAALDEPELETS